MSSERRRRWAGAVALLVVLVAGPALLLRAWLASPLQLSDAIVIDLPAGGSVAALLHRLGRDGVVQQPGLLVRWATITGAARQAKAGEYRLPPGTSHQGLLALLAAGGNHLRAVTLVEGSRFAAMRQAVAGAARVKASLAGLSANEVMAALDRPGQDPEGALFPDTYRYSAGTTDRDLLRRAAERMDQVLAEEWAQRTADLPLTSPQQALILASMVEKESGWAPDRPRIAAVFHNRLRRGMRLQSDPTVIHGLGEDFDGNLRRADLRHPSPYNTYRHHGLPPGPIAAPGRAALRAVLQPAASTALYFVGRGDGTSAFSDTLAEHQAAVRRYQLNRSDNYRSAPPTSKPDAP